MATEDPVDSELDPEPIAADGPDAFPTNALVDAWGQRDRVQIVGASGGFAALVYADIARRVGRPTVVVTPSPQAARRLADELRIFAAFDVDSPSVHWYPEYDVGPYHGASPDRQLAMRRLSTLHALGAPRAATPPIVVTSIAAAVRKTVSKKDFLDWSRIIEVNGEWSDADLRDLFIACGYTEVTTVEDAGTFAIRGDIVDIYSPGEAHPIRIERWGDDIAGLRAFDASTQRTIEEVNQCAVFPVREEILDRRNMRSRMSWVTSSRACISSASMPCCR